MRRAATMSAVLLSVVGLVTAYMMSKGGSKPVGHYAVPKASTADLQRVATSSVFFAHQSVGYNILDAVPHLYGSRTTSEPGIVESADVDDHRPGIWHVRIGTNGDPVGKIDQFDSIIRGGVGDRVDVAILKLCYVDIKEGADVDRIFTAYRDTLNDLQRDYPKVRFVAATVPLTTERGPLGRVKALLGRGDTLGPEHNVVREELNQRLRAEYSTGGSLIDIAAVQSTEPSGERVATTYEGRPLYAMYDGYSSDPGHLNPRGAAVVAEAMLAEIAAALSSRS